MVELIKREQSEAGARMKWTSHYYHVRDEGLTRILWISEFDDAQQAVTLYEASIETESIDDARTAWREDGDNSLVAIAFYSDYFTQRRVDAVKVYTTGKGRYINYRNKRLYLPSPQTQDG